MLNSVKFRKATSPAFNNGEIWVSASGIKVEIISVRKYPGATSEHSSDYAVTYKTDPYRNPEHIGEKDAWSFQVRYVHQSDAMPSTF